MLSMASSDDEEELVLQSVTNYYFLDVKDEPISFSILPVLFDDKEKSDASQKELFLHGTGDGGLQKVYKQVIAWKIGLQDECPEIMVLTKDSKWIKLLKPRKSYEDTIRTILITVQLLHFLRRKPESSEKSLWDHLCKTFSSFEDKPSVNDLLDHYPLIKLLIDRDGVLAKCQILQLLLKEQPRKRSSGVDFRNDSDSKTSFIDDDVEEDMGNDDEDESDEEPDLFDSVCAICDNGGTLLCCEGSCMRSFHPTRADGEDSECASIGLTKAQVEALKNFLCKNCQYKQHQCFACGKLGSSDKSSNAEVFRCVNATCGHFYHPKCVAYLLYKENERATEQKKIADGESFTCPVHRCFRCKEGENKEVRELQFAVCRRCPTSYHRKCLPEDIPFDDIEDEEIPQRAWDDLLPNRILIYCLKHKIDEDLGTPIRNHIKFPDIPERRPVAVVQKSKASVLVKKRQVSDKLPEVRAPAKSNIETKKVSSSEASRPVVKSGRSISEQVLNFQKELKPVKITRENESHKSDGSVRMDSRKPSKSALPTVSSPSAGNVNVSSYPKIDAETEKRMIILMEGITPSLTLDDIVKKFTVPSTHASTARNVERSITHGKVEGSVEAVKTALRKLENGGTVEDARAVCEPDILKQLLRWSSKLKVYLAPVLHGMRYTSFGRHFTKVDKLVEIVDKLQWYVQSGDTIVDFCCGANDFSRLMKEKLDAAGKKCSYKNFDVIQPKNDFNFERRDWMTVQPRELPTGSQLIMGLNPPFGVKAALANKFIDKALTFKPKLVILIVPKETERLDQKRSAYDLIWEDCEKLSGKSFYLPGSVDINDMQMDQWNNKPPPLYLWSRPDWTSKHRSIAMKQGHLPDGQQQQQRAEEGTQVERHDVNHHKEQHTSERHEKKEPITPKENIREGQQNKKIAETERHEKRELVVPKETTREGLNKKIEEESKKRSYPEDLQSMSRNKRKKLLKKKKLAEAQAQAEQRKRDEQSDMSISPPDIGNSARDSRKGSPPDSSKHSSRATPNSQQPSLETFETPREAYPTLVQRSEPRSDLGFGVIPQVGSGVSNPNEDIDDIAKRYATPLSTDAFFSGGSHNWSGDRIGAQEYAARTSADAFSRNSYADPRMQKPVTYGFPGLDEPLQRRGYPLGNPEPGSGHSAIYPSAASSSLGSSSVIDRYAPRLDDVSYPRGPRNVGPAAHYPHGVRDNPPDTYGFAAPAGHQNPYQRSSGGWLDE